MIIDDQGELVWFSKHTTARDFKVQYYRGRPVLTWWEGRVVAEHCLGEHVIFDGSYREIAWCAGNSLRGDLHEFLITPQDTALLTAYATARTDLSPIGGPGRCLHSPCRHAVLGSDRASALYTPIFRGEAVWKIRMGSTLRFYGSEKTGSKAPLSLLCDTKNTRSRPLQLFSKQFRKGNSAKFWRYKTGS
jgi:hypothetical protein